MEIAIGPEVNNTATGMFSARLVPGLALFFAMTLPKAPHHAWTDMKSRHRSLHPGLAHRRSS